MLYRLARPALFTLDPERAHGLAIAALKALPGSPAPSGGPLETHVAGLAFPNPVGMAAGFDKDGEVPVALLGLGFGFVEVGSITPRPQAGNPRPRLFRLAEDRAVINRMGFNNGGAAAAAARLAAREKRGIVGINVGANKDSADRIADYAQMTQVMAPLASYLAINISSPNTPGLRALQDEGALTALLDAVLTARGEAGPPIFLKVAPDLEPADLDETEAPSEQRVGGFAVLVEARGHAERVREGEPGDGRLERPTEARRAARQGLERRDRQSVRPLGIEREQRGPGEAVEHGAGYGSAPIR